MPPPERSTRIGRQEIVSSPDRRVALVTGASSGIGRATSLLLSTAGYAVSLVDIASPTSGDLAAEILARSGVEPMLLETDVSTRPQVDAAVAQTLDRHGRLDVLVTCAGHIELVPLSDLSEETLRRMLDVHLNGTIYCVQAAIGAMEERRYGRIVCLSSAAASKGVAEHSHYAAAKAGIIGFAKSAARELGPRGITINCVQPGAIDTPLLASLSDDARANLARTPVGRMGTPEDVAYAVCFLASPEAGFITGTTLLVTGGECT